MRISRDGLRLLLSRSVVELGFTRRNEKAGWPQFRRMLCTLDRNLLNSLAGRTVFNFYNPNHPPPYDTRAYNLLTTYDLLWQSWRNIPVESANIINAIPTHTKQDQDKFWALFEAQFRKMSPNDKIRFMQTV